MRKRTVETLVIGSGAAGLTAAVRRNALGGTPVVYTEGLRMGTSINTGSDKQTYYKLGMYGAEPDSPVRMAQDLMRGGSMHGDLALIESALSQRTFAHLVNLGVPFPCDEFGQYIGYKTDHDPKRRATSCGPYTSREMCESLIGELKRRNIEVCEQRVAVELLVEDGVCKGALFVDLSAGNDFLELVEAKHTVFACGGPGGLYRGSVYPAVHTGAIGLALQAGAKARNLAESQFGLASVKFRWNVSGSYMQVLPRFVSVDADGTEREFLREYFPSPAEQYDMIFLKGYQWPFAAEHVPGSSLIDLFVYIETVRRGRRVFLNYRSDPDDYDFSAFGGETKDYLIRSGAVADSPLERLRILNNPAIELYRAHGIDLAKEPLEIAVSAQHNNGGLAGDSNWESENIRELFPVGEVNGSHGATRPGGTALNAGQCGAFRATEEIAFRANRPYAPPVREPSVLARFQGNNRSDWRAERRIFQERMTARGAFLRSRDEVAGGLRDAQSQLARHRKNRFEGASARDVAELLRNEQLLVAQTAYLSAILAHIDSGAGSRGGSVVLDSTGIPVLPGWRIAPENESFRAKTLETVLREGSFVSEWVPCRPIPETDGWFENVWKEFERRRNQNV